MPVPAQYQSIIASVISGEWHFLTKRADIPPLPLWLKLSYSSSSRDCEALYGVKIPWFAIWHANEMELYLRAAEYRRAAEAITERLYTPRWIDEHLKVLANLCAQARAEAKFFVEEVLTEVSTQDLWEKFTRLAVAYGRSFVSGFFTWCAPVLQHEVRELAQGYKDKLLPLGIEPAAALGVMLVSSELTDYNQKEQALDKLAGKFQTSVRELALETEKDAREKLSDLDRDVRRFLKCYRWVGYDYNGPAITYEETLNEIATRQAAVSPAHTKDEVMSVCQFNEEEKELFRTLSFVAYAKDLRNQTDDYLHYGFDRFFAEVARRFGLAHAEVKYLWPEELQKVVSGPQIDAGYIAAKKNWCAAVSAAEMVGLKPYYVGEEARELKAVRFSVPKDEAKKDHDPHSQPAAVSLTGMVANPGKVTGAVKVVYSYADCDKVKLGDILVAYMTSPRFMPAILRAGAIVTNDGGLTCHAAIIAREYGKPCVVGTGTATEVLSDGDLVQVDAVQGIVKKL